MYFTETGKISHSSILYCHIKRKIEEVILIAWSEIEPQANYVQSAVTLLPLNLISENCLKFEVSCEAWVYVVT